MAITTILAEVGSPVAFDVSATDADFGEQLTFTTSGLPSGALMTPALPFTGPSGSTVTFNWTPGFGDLGSYVLLFAITDQAGQQAFCVRRITVVSGAQNQPPSVAINPRGPLFVTTGNTVDFDVTGTDPDPNNTVILTALSGMPPGATMTPVLPMAGPASGVTSHFHWASAQAGTYAITYRATDDYGATATKSITLNVGLQSPPVLTIIPSGPLSVQHKATVSFTVTGTDPNAGDSVTVALVNGLPAGATMSPVLPAQGPASGVSSGFIWKPTLLQLGQHAITYSATDLTGNTVSQEIVINVVPGPNTPPALAVNPAGPITVIEGTPITYVVTGTDTDPLDIVTLSLKDGQPAGSTMTPNLPASGPGSGTSSTFNWTPTHPETVTVSYRVNDIIGEEATGSITLYVIADPNPNHPPVADAGSDQTLDCSGPNGLSVHLNGSTSSDPDGDPLQYIWTGPFGSLSDASITVTLPLGQTTVLLTVSDGNGGIASDSIVVTILQDSDAPVFAMNTASMTLWPADHSYHTIGIADCLTSVVDACDGNIDLRNVKIIKVSSDEPEDLTCPPDSGGGGHDDDDDDNGGGSGDDDDDDTGGGSGDDDDDDNGKGNNGVGNGYDPQPPGNPPVNDGPGTGPGNPGNGGGKSSGGGKSKGNNGVGNGYDPQPPGNPPVNDGLGTSPGNPGKGGGSKAKKSSAKPNAKVTLVTSGSKSGGSKSSGSHDDDDDNGSKPGGGNSGGGNSGGSQGDDDDDDNGGGGSQGDDDDHDNGGGGSHDDDDDDNGGGGSQGDDDDDDNGGGGSHDDDDDANGGVCAADHDATGDGATAKTSSSQRTAVRYSFAPSETVRAMAVYTPLPSRLQTAKATWLLPNARLRRRYSTVR